jgi:flagellar biosynthesis protein FlhF
MEQFTVVARTEEECVMKVRKQFGDVFVKILRTEPVPATGLLGPFKKNLHEYRGYVEAQPDLSKYASSVVMGHPPRAAAAPVDQDVERQKILALKPSSQDASSTAAPSVAADKGAAPDKAPSMGPSMAGEKKAPLGTVSNELVERLISEFHNVKDMVAAGIAPAAVGEHKTVTHIRKLLLANKFTESYLAKVVGRLKREFTVEQLDDVESIEHTTLGWISGDLSFYDEDREPTAKPRIFTIIGPTGIGKTTTVAKIAFAYGWPEKINGGVIDSIRAVGRYKQKVVLLSIDQYKIGADDQIAKYGSLLQIPFCNVHDEGELQEKISFHREAADIILVDTYGNNPREAVKLAKMKELLDACGPGAEYHLAVSATTDGEVFAEILSAFEPFRYRSVILTKIDEARKIGAILSVLAEHGKKISFVTTGQVVPYDIERANAERLLANLVGFKGKYGRSS